LTGARWQVIAANLPAQQPGRRGERVLAGAHQLEG
jgi:hypothetical protein